MDRAGDESQSPPASPTAADVQAESAKIRAQQARPRRCPVSAPSVPSQAIRDYEKPVYPKDAETHARIRSTLLTDEKMKVLFGHLSDGELNDVVNAIFSKDISQGEDIIRQGENGDSLYIINEGDVDIFVARPGPDGAVAPGDRGAKVVTFSDGALFGELALMYNAPRAATVTAASAVVKLWVLGERDFKMLLARNRQEQYAKYEGWLSEVELLRTLNHFELASLADALQTDCFDAGEEIIKQGEIGDKFYILEEGEASAFISGSGGEKHVKTYNRQGDYFGEVALLTSEPRKATVRAEGNGCSLVSLSKDDFTSLLGPISDILKEHADKYPQYADFLK